MIVRERVDRLEILVFESTETIVEYEMDEMELGERAYLRS